MKNLIETFHIWFKNTLECSKITVFQENATFEDESLKILDQIVEQTNTLHAEIVSLYLINFTLNNSIHFVLLFFRIKKR